MPVMPDKAGFVNQCCFVYSVTWETAPKAAPSGKEWISIFIRTHDKTNKWAGNMLMCHVDVNMKRHGIRLVSASGPVYTSAFLF